MASNVLNLEIDQGATRIYTFTCTDSNDDPMDITGMDLRAQVRKTYRASPAIDADNDTKGGLAITDGVNGVFTWTITPALSSAIVIHGDDDSLDCVYDVEVVDGSVVYKPAKGTFTVNREVTK